MNEARSEQDEAPSVDKARLVSVRTAMVTLRDDVTAKKAAIEAKLADLATHRAELIADVDVTIADVTDLLARAATFVIAQAGWGFAFDFRTHTYAAILAQCAELVARWDARLAQFQSKLLEVAAAPEEEKKLALLADAERLIATTSAPPPLPAFGVYLSDLTNVRLPPFVAKRDQFAAVAASTDTTVSTLLARVRALMPIDAFEFAAFELTPHEDAMMRFYEDTVVLFGAVIGELERRLSASQGCFDQHDTAASASARVEALELAAKALLGEDFRIIPEFSPSAAQSSELSNALADSASGVLFDYLVNPPEPGRDALDFPVDTWLYGVARVREKLHAWEQVVVFAGALGRPEPELTALQLPFTPNDRWLGLEFPPDQKLDRDRLLYTAHFTAPFTAGSKQCGLLLDEWSETIPLPRVDTGITFHHDRPNSEAPQSMLLVTPPEFRGAWRWDDLVAALNETLELAKRRTFEPKHVEDSALAGIAPATVSANQARQLTIGLDFARNNRIDVAMKG